MRPPTAAIRRWFEMPADVEKVAICRLSGARAAPSCRHQYIPPDAPVGTLGITSAGHLATVMGLPPSEPPVYEEIFAVGALSSELCPLHAPQQPYGGISGDGVASRLVAGNRTPS